MVKGTSRQVIVMQSPDQKLFDQAIFILKDEVLRNGGISDEALLKEAKALIRSPESRRPGLYRYGAVWALSGAVGASLLWLLVLL